MMESDLHDRHLARRTYDRVAGLYDSHAALEQEVGSRLLERLDFHRLPPQCIIDLGSGTGHASAVLKTRFRKAQVIGLDSSPAMLAQLRRRSGLLRPLRAVCADFSALPLAERSSQLIFSNLAFHWSHELVTLFAEIRRVLAPGGMLLFSMLGPASLKELWTARASVEEAVNTRGFIDILEVGDALMAAGFQEPVMDAERITLSYPDFDSLDRELEATGTIGFLYGSKGLGEDKAHLAAAYEPFRIDGKYPVSYEIIYGTAFGPQEGQPRKTADGDVVTFSVESLRRSKKATN
jgi:malonyl-CoA O-methyltransferase